MKHFWAKRVDDDSNKKRPSWAWGVVHVLGYHHWRFNIKKMIKFQKQSGQTHDHRNLILEKEMFTPDGDLEEIELPDQNRMLLHNAKASPATKKRSIRERMKLFKPSKRSGKRSKEESADTDWKHPIVLVQRNEDDANKETDFAGDENGGLNVLEIFKVDNELLVKHLHDADEGIAKFSRSALRFNSKSKLSKSRSFPVATLPGSVKVKPATLENKQKDVWLVPREDRKKTRQMDCTKSFDFDKEGDGRKTVHRRCSSLNESLEKYTRLLDTMNFHEDVKLKNSRSSRFANENTQANLSFRRKHSLSNADLYCPDECPSDDGLAVRNNEEETESIQSKAPADDRGSNNSETSDPNLVIRSDLETNEAGCHSTELQFSDMEVISSDDVMKCVAEDSENDEMGALVIANYSKNQKSTSDLDYVRQILNQSGLAMDDMTISWHSSDQPLSPRVFEELEACCSHEQDEELGDFCGCWHHQMLFDLVNEMLVDLYDVSAPYYPKPLFFGCHVRPFPFGEHMTEVVCSRAGCVLDLKGEEKQSMNSILMFDHTQDQRWMNLQMEAECVALSVEDMVFDLLEELVSCN